MSSVTAAGGGRPARLAYTSMVSQEAMRLYPPIYLVLRRAVADDEIAGYRIPAGANIALCPYVTHRHPGFWDNPEGFEPERFAPEAARRRHRMAFFPFLGRLPGVASARATRCSSSPGGTAMVAQRYRLSLLRPAWPRSRRRSPCGRAVPC